MSQHGPDESLSKEREKLSLSHLSPSPTRAPGGWLTAKYQQADLGPNQGGVPELKERPLATSAHRAAALQSTARLTTCVIVFKPCGDCNEVFL